jgi:hypothetical protein
MESMEASMQAAAEAASRAVAEAAAAKHAAEAELVYVRSRALTIAKKDLTSKHKEELAAMLRAAEQKRFTATEEGRRAAQAEHARNTRRRAMPPLHFSRKEPRRHIGGRR